MPRIEVVMVLDQPVLDELVDLIERVTAQEGHRPVGEHKYAHLALGAKGWTGVLARDQRGRLVGYAHLRWSPPGARPRLAVEIVVAPQHDLDEDREVVARALVQQVRALVRQAGGGALWLWVNRVEDPHITLAARMGLRVQRELAFMTRPLPSPPAFALPSGVELRPYRPGADDEALLAVNNAAFAGHPENGNWDERVLAERRALDWFDPADALLAWRGDALLGFHWTKWHGHDSDEVPAHEPVGEVYVLAVHPEAHGQGLGRMLLRAGLTHLHGRGCRLAVLYVDVAERAPLELYRSEGFSIEYLQVCYEDLLAPEPTQPALDLLRPV